MSSSVFSRRSALALLASAPLACRTASAATTQTLRVGIMSGEDEDVWRIVAQNAAKTGLTLKLVPFSDYNGPNEALYEHELDANAFQHGPFLKAQNDANNFGIVPVGNTYFAPIGLYSSRWNAVATLPKNATIGVPNDPSNEGRALLLLQKLGLIKLAENAGLTPTALDIAENPHNITVKELDAGVVGRTLSDLDAAVINTEWAQKSGIDVVKQRIGQESLQDNPYVCFIAVNAADQKAPWVAPLVEAFHQPNVRQTLIDIYHGAIVPAWS